MMSSTYFVIGYARHFQCLVGRCPDYCCFGWLIPIDAASQRKLVQRLSVALLDGDEHGLRSLLAASGESLAGYVAKMTQHPVDTPCSFLDPDGACFIHRHYGIDPLPDVCALYPRWIVHLDSGRIEITGQLSCPEMARLCLLGDDQAMTWHQVSPEELSEVLPISLQWPRPTTTRQQERVRDLLLHLMGLRHYPLAVRLIMLGIASGRLQAKGYGTTILDNASLQATIQPFLNPQTVADLAGLVASSSLLVDGMASSMVTIVQFLAILAGSDRPTAQRCWQWGKPVLDDPTLPLSEATCLSLWQGHCQRRDRWRSNREVAIDLFFERYGINFIVHTFLATSCDLNAFLTKLVISIAVLRFLFYLALEQTFPDGEVDQKGLEQTALDVIQAFSKANFKAYYPQMETTKIFAIFAVF